MSERMTPRNIYAAGILGCVTLNCLTTSTAQSMSFPYPTDVRFVAMGDSFAAGTGAGNYEEGTNTENNHCRRSEYAPAAQIADEFHLAHFLNIACRGASIPNLYEGQYTEPGQLQSLPPDTGVVVLSLGGNMANLADILRHCEQSCTPDDEVVLALTDHLQLEEFKQGLQEAYSAILARAPEADVYVTEYTTPIKQRSWCPPLVSQEADRFVDGFVSKLNGAIDSAVSTLNSPQVTIVPAPAGTDICATLGTGATIRGEDIGHPTPSTAQKIGRAIVAAMIEHERFIA